MPYPTALSPLFTFFLATSMAIAQTGDWQTVQHLPSGTRLKIKLQRGRTFGHCAFMGATDDVLDCDYPGLTYIQGHYRRDNVKAVYLTYNARAIGLGIGAGAGAILGVTTIHAPAANRGFLTLIDVGILGGTGYFFGMILDPFLHGRAVYLSPNPTPNVAPSPMAKPRNPNPPANNLPCLRDGVTRQCIDRSSTDE